MDDQVLRGMARWPNVPAVFGWLALDRRGTWLLQGDPIANPVVVDYIGRNYDRDDEGRWYFQNGPQRVYVALDYTPWVYRALGAAARPLMLETHTGRPVQALSGAWVDERGSLILQTEHGPGVLHDRDLDAVLPALVDGEGKPLADDALERAFDALQHGRSSPIGLRHAGTAVAVEPLHSAGVPQRFSYVREPRA